MNSGAGVIPDVPRATLIRYSKNFHSNPSFVKPFNFSDKLAMHPQDILEPAYEPGPPLTKFAVTNDKAMLTMCLVSLPKPKLVV